MTFLIDRGRFCRRMSGKTRRIELRVSNILFAIRGAMLEWGRGRRRESRGRCRKRCPRTRKKRTRRAPRRQEPCQRFRFASKKRLFLKIIAFRTMMGAKMANWGAICGVICNSVILFPLTIPLIILQHYRDCRELPCLKPCYYWRKHNWDLRQRSATSKLC